jgi:hypothetical protein
MSDRIEKLTARHIARALRHLKEVKTPACAIDAVRREFWFLHDDIKAELDKTTNT